MAENELSDELKAILPQIAGPAAPGMPMQPGAPLDERLVRLADQGDDDALVLLAVQSQMSGNWVQLAGYAPRLLELGAVHQVGNIAANLLGDPEQANLALDLLEDAIRAGYPADPIAYIQQFAQRGDFNGVARLTAIARELRPGVYNEEEWSKLTERLARSQESLDSELNTVADARAVAVESIASHERAIDEEAERLQRLGAKIEALGREKASIELAKSYDNQAKRSGRAATGLTTFAILFGLAAAVIAVIFAVNQANMENPDVSEGAVKALIALPLALFAAYLGRLATSFRRTAWQWRHIQLQLETAELYISEVPEERRLSLQEALALRFFPGQPLDPFRDSSDSGAAVTLPTQGIAERSPAAQVSTGSVPTGP